jgi:xanthine dehydrogenase YagS FAD-binding subunit
MAMNRFAYASASTVDEALEVLADTEHPDDCRPLAGGVDLLDRMKEGLISPARLVDLKRIPGLDQVRAAIAEDANGVHAAIAVGALTPLYRLLADPAIAERAEMACLRQALIETASPQIRHMATIGGNLLQRPRCWYLRNKLTHCLRKGGERCFAFRGENERHAILGGGPCYIVHPSDPAVALLALGASVVVVGAGSGASGGARTVPLADFYLLPRQDAQREADLASNEILTEILIPTPAAGSRGIYLKVPERGARDFALSSVAVQLVLAGEGVRDARVALGGVAPVPWRALEAEQALVGQALSDAAIEQASLAATAGARPLAQNAFKIELVQGIVRQALRALREENRVV